MIAIPPTTIQVPHRGRFSCVSQLSIEDSSSTFSSRIHRYHRRSPILPKFEIFLTLTFHIFENHSSTLLWWNTHKVSSSTILTRPLKTQLVHSHNPDMGAREHCPSISIHGHNPPTDARRGNNPLRTIEHTREIKRKKHRLAFESSSAQ